MKRKCNLCNCYTVDQQQYFDSVDMPLEGMQHYLSCAHHKQWMIDKFSEAYSLIRFNYELHGTHYEEEVEESIAMWRAIADWRLNAKFS